MSNIYIISPQFYGTGSTGQTGSGTSQTGFMPQADQTGFTQQQTGFPQQQQQQQQQTGSAGGDINQILGSIMQPLMDMLMSLVGGQGTSGGQASTNATDEAPPSQNLALLEQNQDDLSLFDKDEDGKLSRSELLEFSKSDEEGISEDAKKAAKWLAGSQGKSTFNKLDGFNDDKTGDGFKLAALKHVGQEEDIDDTGTAIENGQDALNVLNDEELLKNISTKDSKTGKDVIDFSKLQEVANSDDDKYTDEQKEAAQFILDNDELKQKLDENNDGTFFTENIGKLLNEDPSISEIGSDDSNDDDNDKDDN